MVEHVALLTGLARPAKPGFPTSLAPVGAVVSACLAIGKWLPIFAFANFDCAGFRRRGEVDVDLGTVIDIGHESYTFGPSMKALGDRLSSSQHPRTGKGSAFADGRMAEQGRNRRTYSSGLGPLLFRASIGVECECRHASLPAVLDNLALCVVGADFAGGVAGCFERTLLFELVGRLDSRHAGTRSTLRPQRCFFRVSIGSMEKPAPHTSGEVCWQRKWDLWECVRHAAGTGLECGTQRGVWHQKQEMQTQLQTQAALPRKKGTIPTRRLEHRGWAGVIWWKGRKERSNGQMGR